MGLSLDQILPSLESLGSDAYWLIGLAALFEAFFLTGVVIPGTLIVEEGGLLVQRGFLDFLDLVWFVAVGSALGAEASFWTGRLAMNRLPGRQRLGASAPYARAARLFDRRGSMALVIGQFLGPVAGFVPMVAGMTGMARRTFLIWNILGSVAFALVHVTVGFVLSDVLGRIGGALTRDAALAGALVAALVVLWGILYAALRFLPLAWAAVSAALRNVADLPVARAWIAAHPGVAGRVAARLDRSVFSGLRLSVLVAVLGLLGLAWVDLALALLRGDTACGFDARLAELIHHFQSPQPVAAATFVSAIGSGKVVLPLALAVIVWLAARGRVALAAGLAVSAVGNAVSIALLKLAFGRPRPPFGVFAETSGSFPSSHAASSVAVFGMLIFVVWRAGRIRAETALLLAGLVAFGIGGARVYLGVHYPGDVLAGWLVGAMWATAGIAVAEWRLSHGPAARPMAKVAGTAAALALCALAAVNVWRYDPPRRAPVAVADRVLSQIALLEKAGLPAETERLMGSPVRPVSIVLIARDQDAVTRAILAAGWSASPLPSAGVVADALYAALARSGDPTVETVSHFWRGEPNGMAFVRYPSTARAGPRDPRLRVWQTPFVTPEGAHVFVGTIGVDAGDGDPAAGRGEGERAALADALQARGAQVGPTLRLQGQGRAGQAIVLTLP